MTNNVDLSTLAGRCKFRREQLGLSQAKLAKLAGYSTQSGISAIEEGKIREPSKILALADALGVQPDWLATGEEHVPPARLVQWESRPGYQMVEIRREMPAAFAHRLLGLMLELDLAELRQAEENDA